MPPKPVVSQTTAEWKRYYICERHMTKRKPKTENYIRTYGACPCFVTCNGQVHADNSWNICVDKTATGRCDFKGCNHFYLRGRAGFIDTNDGRCYWDDTLEPIRTIDGGHFRFPLDMVEGSEMDDDMYSLTADDSISNR